MGVRNDAIVAARVPDEIKEQVNEILNHMGCTPTHLINSAYLYVLEYQRLPFESALPKPGKRMLDEHRMQQIANELALLQVSTYDYSQGGTKTFKEALTEKLKSEYEKQR